jgi:kynurenine formamidase
MKYAELPLVDGTPERHAWDYFPVDDQVGTVNRLGAAELISAAKLVESGKAISLNLPLDEPGPLADGRSSYRHLVEVERFGRDDKLDNLYLQGSTQWDGLRHIRFRQHGYYGGRQDSALDSTGVLGIDHLAARGVFGRGVLLDVAGFKAASAEPWPVDERTEISVETLEAVASDQRVSLCPGDILLIRTGWLAWCMGLSPDERQALPSSQTMSCVGLDPRPEMAEWLWDHGISAIASDNPALEALPVDKDLGFLHHRLLPLLGYLIGELFTFEHLSKDCGADGRYDGMFVSVPLHLKNGVGSPANAFLLK